MKIGTIIELVYQRVSGGRLTPDIDVMRVDIMAYLPAAINSAIREHYFAEISIKSMEKISALLPDLFIKVYEDVPVKYNERRQVRYIDFPSPPIAILDSYGLKSIAPMVGDIEFMYMKNRHHIKGYEEYVGNTVFFWVEGNSAIFKNISPVVSSVLVAMAASVNDLTDDDEAPIPLGMEEKVIDSIYRWFIGQRITPQDKVEDYNRNDEQQ